MEKRALMICGASKASSLAALQRRIISDASSKFDSVELGKMHHIGILDFTKFGRLSMVEINQAADWAKALLNLNAEHSNLQTKFGFWLNDNFWSSLTLFRQPHPQSHMNDNSRHDPRHLPYLGLRWCAWWFAWGVQKNRG